jgi:hypothetical protein
VSFVYDLAAVSCALTLISSLGMMSSNRRVSDAAVALTTLFVFTSMALILFCLAPILAHQITGE